MLNIGDIIDSPFGEGKAKIISITTKFVTCEAVEVPKEETIYVPDNIKIEYNEGSENSIYINKGSQSLGYCYGNYVVTKAIKEREVKCKLIPIDVKDLEVGGTYFHTDNDGFSTSHLLMLYCKYLGNEEYVFWGEGGLYVNENNRKHRYKVVPVE